MSGMSTNNIPSRRGWQWPFNRPESLDGTSYIPILEACIVGAVAGASAVLLSFGVNTLGTLRVHFSETATMHFALPVFGLLGGLLAGMLVEKVAPEAAGSGIPQVRAALDRVRVALDFRVALAKLLGGVLAIGAGLFMGREGPTVQLGAAVAAPLSSWIPTTLEHRRQLIAAGAGAGLTAAFNAPLAGVIFVLEELLKEVKSSTVIITITACSISCLILNLVSPPHLRLPVHNLTPQITFDMLDGPFYVLLGIVCGIAGGCFNLSILFWLNVNKKLPGSTTLKVGFAGLLSGLIMSGLPEIFHDYAGMRALIVAGATDCHTVVVGLIGFYLMTLIAYGSGAPGGLFAPTLAIGSTLGYLVGFLEQSVIGTGSTAAFALVGMGAFFAGVARVPLTAIALTFELTTNFTLLTPLMLSCLISSVVGEFVSRGSLYDRLMEWSGINLRGPGTNANARAIKARDVMRSKVDTLASNMPLKEALAIFSSSNQKGFPVLEQSRLVGVITQTDLGKIVQTNIDENLTVRDLMTSHPVAVSPYDDLEDILFLFSRHKFTWLPVLRYDKLKGIIFESDVVGALFANVDSAEDASKVGRESA